MRYIGVAGALRNLLLLCWLLSLPTRGGSVSCDDSFDIPKVAILFLARGDMPLTAVWEPWFRSVSGLVPIKDVVGQACGGLSSPLSKDRSCTFGPEEPLLKQQALFTVYIHSSRANFSDFPPGHLFAGTLIPEVVPTNWGDTIDATQAQLRHALQEPRNQRFLLLSDTDIPLYPARMVYLQLMSETKSRVSACKAWDLVNINRYTCQMAEKGVGPHHWRKGAQWLSLLRHHALMVATDELVRAAFNQHCAGVFHDTDLDIHRGCLSDEHYYHTLFAVMGKEAETDCKGSLSFSDFTNSFEGHPRKYVVRPSEDPLVYVEWPRSESDTIMLMQAPLTADEIAPSLISDLRMPIPWLGKATCSNDEGVWRQSWEGFKQAPFELSDEDCDLEGHEIQFRPMESWCHLFARKFAPDAAAPLAQLFTAGTSNNIAIYNL